VYLYLAASGKLKETFFGLAFYRSDKVAGIQNWHELHYHRENRISAYFVTENVISTVNVTPERRHEHIPHWTIAHAAQCVARTSHAFAMLSPYYSKLQRPAGWLGGAGGNNNQSNASDKPHS
jgi:hypothetical protein